MGRIVYLLITALTIIVDQITKQLAVTYLKPIDTKPLIEGVLHLTYLENTGAAFGMMKDHRWVFMTTSTIAVVAILVFMMGWYNKFHDPLLFTGLSMIAGGGIGNMIDRIALGYVVDFVDFRLINFAIFNAADSFVCVGAGLIVLWVILSEIKEKKSSQKS